jgi:hypothetical protein
MRRVLGRNLHGYYFATEENMADILTSNERVSALYGERVSCHTGRLQICLNYLFGEVVFSAPEEQCVCFDQSGNPRFQERNGTRDFSSIARCHAGIEQFVEDMLALDSQLLDRQFDNTLIDTLFGLFTTKRCVCSESVRESFVFSDYYNPNSSDVKLVIGA